MIRKPTVFVVGAGGSIPYGYPSGPSMLRTARTRSVADIRELTSVGNQRSVQGFKDAIMDCESDSLDSLLEFRDDLNEVGRRYIASEILRAEDANYDTRPDQGDWFSYLFNQMDGRTLEEFIQTPVTFVTYNYDRRIENQVSRGLRARFRISEDVLQAYWRDRPVIHLHGAVGSFLHGDSFVPFGARDTDEAADVRVGANLHRAAEGIRVVHQADGNAPEFEAARVKLRAAECVFFLGFSFGRTNVDRLGLDSIRPETVVVCSRYRMTDTEAGIFIQQPLNRLRKSGASLGTYEQDCLAVLRTYLNHFAVRYADG